MHGELPSITERRRWCVFLATCRSAGVRDLLTAGAERAALSFPAGSASSAPSASSTKISFASSAVRAPRCKQQQPLFSTGATARPATASSAAALGSPGVWGAYADESVLAIVRHSPVCMPIRPFLQFVAERASLELVVLVLELPAAAVVTVAKGLDGSCCCAVAPATDAGRTMTCGRVTQASTTTPIRWRSCAA